MLRSHIRDQIHQRDLRSTGVTDGEDLTRRIRRVINEHGHLPVDLATLSDETDLFQAGMTSHASVNVMLGLEAEFDIEFPDAMLKRSVFQSVAAIRSAINRLAVAAA
jgi:acyl carrier protein